MRFSSGRSKRIVHEHKYSTFLNPSNPESLTVRDNGNYPIYNATTPTSGLATEVELPALQASLNKQYLSSKDPMPL
jgi:hypothetical protein